MGARIDVGFGYDTKGLVEFLDNGYDPVDLVKGFYIRDQKNGVDIPEATLSASIKGGVSLDIAVASAGAGGGIYADLFLNLHDYPELDGTFDGKIRFQEIADHVNPFDPKTYLCLFDFSGQLSAGLYAYFQVGWPPSATARIGKVPVKYWLPLRSKPIAMPTPALCLPKRSAAVGN
ncbi:MAG: hypothetical protein HC899_37525 [Leptolyngbyaceae cyanobacterium SM1_4_3]|nr:hypothetical protein [Leptolyngbyaceae cyanobacterium SM1_4_3]